MFQRPGKQADRLVVLYLWRAPATVAQQQQPPQEGESQPAVSYSSDARPLLPKASFFMGDLRDGLPMVRFPSDQTSVKAPGE